MLQSVIQELSKMRATARQLNDLKVINKDLELKIGTEPKPIRLIDQEYKDNVQQKAKTVKKIGDLYWKFFEIEGEINRTMNAKLQIIHERFALVKKIQNYSVEDADKFTEEILLSVDSILCDMQVCEEYNFPLKITYNFLESIRKKLFVWQTEVRTNLSLNNTITYVVGCWEVNYGQNVLTWSTLSGVYRYEIELLNKRLNLFKNTGHALKMDIQFEKQMVNQQANHRVVHQNRL